MALLRTEKYTNEEGVEMKREIYDTMVIEGPAEEEAPAERAPTARERLEADMAYIKMKLRSE